MSNRTQYSDEFKARALQVVEMEGGNVAAAVRSIADLYGDEVPESTVRSWTKGVGTKSVPAKLHGEKKDELLSGLKRMLSVYLEAGEDEKKAKATSGKDIATVIGILVDKIQLLEGKPTEIQESRVRESILRKLERHRAN